MNRGNINRAQRADGGSFVRGHARAQQIGNGDRGNDQDEGNDEDAEIPQHQAGDGDALTADAAGGFANFGERHMAENNCGDGGGQEKGKDSADQAGDRFAAGGRVAADGRRSRK